GLAALPNASGQTLPGAEAALPTNFVELDMRPVAPSEEMKVCRVGARRPYLCDLHKRSGIHSTNPAVGVLPGHELNVSRTPLLRLSWSGKRVGNRGGSRGHAKRVASERSPSRLAPLVL